MKSNKVLLFVIWILLLSSTQNIVLATEVDQTSYSLEINRFDGVDWINVTLQDTRYNVITASDITGELLYSPWGLIEQKVIDADFFNLQSMEEGNLELIITIGGETNAILFDTILADPTPELGELFALVGTIANNIAGYPYDSPHWPVDMVYYILESYPEQYHVEVLVQRGNDVLTVVDDAIASLVVGFSNQTKNFQFLSEAIYIREQNYSIASGGGSTKVNFDTFTLGVDYRPEDLIFAVIVNNLVISSTGNLGVPNVQIIDEIVINTRDNVDYAPNSSDGRTGSLSYFGLMSIPVYLFIAIVSRRRSRQ